MSTLSICMIVKDEEPVLDRCLCCAEKIADELIVVDTGSTDASVEIARRHTDKVFLHPWQNSFCEARNYAASLASCDYVMWLDADDVISEENIVKIRTLMQDLDPKTDVVFTMYRSGKPGTAGFGLRDRIIRREYSAQWVNDVHEGIIINGRMKRLYRGDIEILHMKEKVNDPDRNLKIFLDKVKDGKPFNVVELAYFCRELCQHDDHKDCLMVFDLYKQNTRHPQFYYYALVFAVRSMIMTGQYERCAAEIIEAFDSVPVTAYMLYHLALCYEKQGKDELARETYLKALGKTDSPLLMVIRFEHYDDYYPCKALQRLAEKAGDAQEAKMWKMRAEDCYI